MYLSENGARSTSSPGETFAHGQEMAQLLTGSGSPPEDPGMKVPLILLHGPLGAGKTLWTGGLVAGLGIISDVHSPSFSLMNVYRSHQACLYHFDLYRLTCLEEVFDLGLFEFINDGNPCVVEWADRVEELAQWSHWSVGITPTGETSRHIEWCRQEGRGPT